MTAALLDTARSLTALMVDELTLLRSDGSPVELRSIVEPKLRLAAQMEAQLAAAARETPEWQAALGPEERAELAEAFAALQSTAVENARAVERRIELSREIMDAIAAEAKRLGGTRRETYAQSGGLIRSDLPAPVAVNTNL